MCFKHERIKFQWKKWVQILHLFTIRVEGADPQKVLEMKRFTNIGSRGGGGGLCGGSEDETMYDKSLIKRRKSLSCPFKDTIRNALKYPTLRHM